MKSIYIAAWMALLLGIDLGFGSAQGMTPEDVRNANKNAVVMIKVSGSGENGVPYENSGTGFIVTPAGEVFTTYHLILDEAKKPLSNLNILGAPGSRYGTYTEMEVISKDDGLDFALMKFKGNKDDYVATKICNGYNIGSNADLIAMGYPLTMELSLVNGKLSNKNGPGGWYQTQTPFAPGYSGGPVFESEKGSVVGMIMGGNTQVQSLNFFMPMHRVANFIAVLSTPPACNPDLKTISIAEGNLNYNQSGYNFSSHEIVSWNSTRGDILVSRNTADSVGKPMFFLPFDAPPYNSAQDDQAHSGILEIPGDSYGRNANCPTSGYTYHWYPATVGQWYCVRNRSGNQYYKIKVEVVNENFIAIMTE